MKNQKTENKTKGRILRVKHGYNPNSSSMGSIIFALPVALLGITTAVGAVSGIIMAVFLKNKKNPKKHLAPNDTTDIEQSAENKGE